MTTWCEQEVGQVDKVYSFDSGCEHRVLRRNYGAGAGNSLTKPQALLWNPGRIGVGMGHEKQTPNSGRREGIQNQLFYFNLKRCNQYNHVDGWVGNV